MQDPAADAAIAREVLARERAGYAALYDRHAAPLYAYCHIMPGDRERAAGALGVILMIAVCRLGELRDPDRLRTWLYALARNECRCRASGGARPPAAAQRSTCQARERRELPSGALAGLLARAAQPAQPPGLRDAVLRELAVTPGRRPEAIRSPTS